MQTKLENHLGNLCEEILVKILEYLLPEDLNRLSILSKSLNRVANDPSLWETFCLERLTLERYEALCKVAASLETTTNTTTPATVKISHEIHLKLFWKRSYFYPRGYVMKDLEPFTYVAALMDRKGTGDSWTYHVGDWKHHLKAHLQKQYSIQFTIEGEIIYNQEAIGTYHLINPSRVLDRYSDLAWLKSNEECKQCPYLGQLIGFIAWSVKPEYGVFFMSRMVETSRGVVAQVSDTSKFLKCVSHHLYPLFDVLDPAKYGVNFFPMIDNKNLVHKPKYLQDIFAQVNLHFKKRHEKLVKKKLPQEQLPKENVNRAIPQKKPLLIEKSSRVKLPSKNPSVFDYVPTVIGSWNGLTPNVTGKEHLDFPEYFKNIRIGVWSYPQLFKSALMAILKDGRTEHPKFLCWKPTIGI